MNESPGRLPFVARVSPLVKKTGRSGCDQRPAAFDVLPHQGTLAIRKGTDIRQDQDGKPSGFFHDVVRVHGHIRNMGAQQSFGKSEVREIHQSTRGIPSEVVGVPLRPHHADVGNGRAIIK